MVSAILMMLVLGALLGCGLALASKFLHVEADPRVDWVTAALPNYNCGGCGSRVDATVCGLFGR